uniref:Uncharacterized protein n=1 Tax=Mustela putorius furo TaxID=9669 RepID=M3YGQ9_MUSPF
MTKAEKVLSSTQAASELLSAHHIQTQPLGPGAISTTDSGCFRPFAAAVTIYQDLSTVARLLLPTGQHAAGTGRCPAAVPACAASAAPPTGGRH